MRCEVARSRLLAAVDSAKAPAEVRAHLIRCEFCRDWHEDLCTIEQHVQYVPVPESRGKAKLLRRLLHEPGPEVPNPESAIPDFRPTPEKSKTLPESSAANFPDTPVLRHPRFFTFPGLMAGLAAVALFVLGTWLMRN
jgi:hypothetical protein